MISVLILTKNEEMDLPGCLASVAWCDDIHVFDSFSTDATARVAEQVGATVTRRTFDGYASQRNAALRGLSFRYPWVLIVDADERIPPALASEMCRFVSDETGFVAGRIRRRDYLSGCHLKHVQASPLYIRLVRPERVAYEREVNEVLRADGLVKDLREPFDHHPFSKGLSHWVDKHNVYSSLEAKEVLRSRQGANPVSFRDAFFARDFSERRFHQKELFYRLPARPLVKFLLLYVLKRGFLDGRAGFVYATLQSIYEYMIVLKTAELERETSAVSPSPPV